MKNKDYWQKRFELLQEAQLNKGQDYLIGLEKQYIKASLSIEKDINNWYARLAKNNNISFLEAKKLLNNRELKEFQWTVEDYIKYGQENNLNGLWIKQLENASAKVHISRLEALKLQLQQQIEVLYGNQTDGIDNLIKNIYIDGYYHTAYEIQKGFNVGWDLQTLNGKQLEQVISKPWTADNKTFKDRCWTNKQELINSVHTNLTQSIIRGDAPDKAIKNISEQFKVSKNKAGKLVMTETAAFSSMAQKDCYNNLGVEKFEVVATLDMKTSEICQDLDGKVFDMKDYQVGLTANPFHVNCRTTTCPYFDDDYGERIARDINGKTYYVSNDMKYKEWKEKFVDKVVKNDIIKDSNCIISDSKFIDYALNPNKDPNKARAFSEALGYDLTNYAELKNNIIDNLKYFKPTDKGKNNYGHKYEILMNLTGANGKTANVKTVWFFEDGSDNARMVSAYVTSKKVK